MNKNMDYFSRIFDRLLAELWDPFIWLAACTLSGFLVLSEEYPSKIGLSKFVENNNTTLGLLFLLSISMILIIIIKNYSFFINIIIIRFRSKKYIQQLTEGEKCILRRFIDDKTKSVRFSNRNGIIETLVVQRVLEPGKTDHTGKNAWFNISPWAWNYLIKNKKLLRG